MKLRANVPKLNNRVILAFYNLFWVFNENPCRRDQSKRQFSWNFFQFSLFRIRENMWWTRYRPNVCLKLATTKTLPSICISIAFCAPLLTKIISTVFGVSFYHILKVKNDKICRWLVIGIFFINYVVYQNN